MTVRVAGLSVTVPDVAHGSRLRVTVGDVSVTAGMDGHWSMWLWAAIGPVAAWLCFARRKKATP